MKCFPLVFLFVKISFLVLLTGPILHLIAALNASSAPSPSCSLLGVGSWQHGMQSRALFGEEGGRSHGVVDMVLMQHIDFLWSAKISRRGRTLKEMVYNKIVSVNRNGLTYWQKWCWNEPEYYVIQPPATQQTYSSACPHFHPIKILGSV